MAYYKFKAKITDDIDDAINIVQMVGKALNEGKTDKASALSNLAAALKKLESARYYIDRE
jgi:hypothetical protein